MSEHQLETLTQRIERSIEGLDTDLDGLACAVYEWQRHHCVAYDRLCSHMDVGPVRRWQDVPAVPTEAFRTVDLRSHRPGRSSVTFRTSGTTGTQAGEHHFQDLTLYRKAALAAFGGAFGLDGASRRCISLIPGVDEQPDSSLSQMVTWVLEEWGDEASGVDRTGETLLNLDRPALILGTSLQLSDWLSRNPAASFPPETAVMETGGFKGQSLEITRQSLHAAYRSVGIDTRRVVGEYGMTELSSQWYDGRDCEAPRQLESRVYVPPPWARTRVVDPVHLNDTADGEPGLLVHYDPVNWGSVQAIRTSDVGIRARDEHGREGFRYLGRVPGARLRGCSMRFEGVIAS